MVRTATHGAVQFRLSWAGDIVTGYFLFASKIKKFGGIYGYLFLFCGIWRAAGWWFVIYGRERVLNMKQRVWDITKEINRLAGIGSRCSNK